MNSSKLLIQRQPKLIARPRVDEGADAQAIGRSRRRQGIFKQWSQHQLTGGCVGCRSIRPASARSGLEGRCNATKPHGFVGKAANRSLSLQNRSTLIGTTDLETSPDEVDQQNMRVRHGFLLRNRHTGADGIIRRRAVASNASVHNEVRVAFWKGVSAVPAHNVRSAVRDAFHVSNFPFISSLSG